MSDDDDDRVMCAPIEQCAASMAPKHCWPILPAGQWAIHSEVCPGEALVARTNKLFKKHLRVPVPPDDDDDRVMCAPAIGQCAAIMAAPPVVVPLGACPGDRITFFDRDLQMLTHRYVTVPDDAWHGDRISGYHEPVSGEKGCHVLVVDGDNGVQTAARQKTQHALRLYVHRKFCTNKECNFLGCRDESYETCGLKSESNAATKEAYKAHWSRKFDLHQRRVLAQAFAKEFDEEGRAKRARSGGAGPSGA